MILIVDDKKENLLSLQSLLTLHGYAVHAASSGDEALKKVLHNNYNLIILDVQMPGMDGFEVAEMISGYSKTNDIPIIFLSAVNTDKKFITKGYSSGAVDYITKPIDPDIFLLKVNTLYKLYEQKRELNEAQANLRSEIEFRKKAQEDSQLKAQELVSILESIPQIAFTTTPEGKLEYCNQEWLNYAGSANKFPATAPNSPPIEEVITNMAEEKTPLECEVQLSRNGKNDYRCFLLRTVPVLKGDEIVKWVGTFTDIEEQKQVSKRKDEFISVASHELKTPLSSMKGYIQLLERTLKPGQPNYLYVERSLVQINKLDNLIADLLDISKIESGKLRLDMDDFNFQDMLNNTIDMIRQTFPNYTIEQAGDANVIIRGDEARLEQVLLNFLSNAVKYSPEVKKVIVHVNILPHKTLEVRIQDFGIGISKEDQVFVFDKFYRTVQSSNHFHGLGLGLYISADILQRHGSEYGVESQPGEGSVFYFKIPFIDYISKP
jgi:signal transduction histidine kinase/CheY-like chemotaxis protein